MATIKLTKWMRESICAAALKDAFGPREADLSRQEDLLFLAVHAERFTAKERDMMEAMPNGFMPTYSGEHVRANAMKFHIRSSMDVRCSQATKYAADYTIKSQDVADQITAHAKAKEDLREERRKADTALTALLGSVTTIAALEKQWPDGKAYCGRYIENAVAPVKLPAVEVSSINAMLGLPKGTTK